MVTRDGTNATAAADMAAAPPTKEKDNTMAMLIMAGVVVSSAGFVMYTKQADSLLRRMNRASKIQGTTKFPTKTKPKPKSRLISNTKSDRNSKAKTFHEKDDFF